MYISGIAKGDKTGARHPAWWVSTTYFAEGFPYALVNSVAEVVFKELGASLQAIGLTAIFHLPWNLKFLWAPVLDRHETKRRFMLACEWLILVPLVALMVLGESIPLWLASIAFLVLAFLAATHDIAIDGYYLEALDQDEQSRFVGLRVALYRGAILLAGGPLLVLAAYAGWRATWAASVLIMIVLLAYHWRYLPDLERRRDPFRGWALGLMRPKFVVILVAMAVLLVIEIALPTVRPLLWMAGEQIARVPGLGKLDLAQWIGLLFLACTIVALLSLGWLRAALRRSNTPYSIGFRALLEQPLIGRALAFIVLFRTGESFLMKMRQPFLRDECGLDLGTFGLINGTLGILVTLLATLVGGWLIARHGLRRWMWPFVLAQNVPNLLYAWLAGVPDPSAVQTWLVGSVVLIEDLGAGLGTAFFMVYLMRCCDPRHKATHMAVLTAIMSIGFTLAGVASGFLVGWLGGFTNFFVFTFIATVPSMVLLPFVPFPSAAADAPPSDP